MELPQFEVGGKMKKATWECLSSAVLMLCFSVIVARDHLLMVEGNQQPQPLINNILTNKLVTNLSLSLEFHPSDFSLSMKYLSKKNA